MAISASTVVNFTQSISHTFQLSHPVLLSNLKLVSSFIGLNRPTIGYIFEIFDASGISYMSSIATINIGFPIMVDSYFGTVLSSNVINSFNVTSITVHPVSPRNFVNTSWSLMFCDAGTIKIYHHHNIVYNLANPPIIPINVNNMGLKFEIAYNNGISGHYFDLHTSDNSPVGNYVTNIRLMNTPQHVLVISQVFHKLHLTTHAFEFRPLQPVISNYVFNVSVYEEY